MTGCPHADYGVEADVNGVILPDGKVGARVLSVKVVCKQCGMPFWFPGMPTGRSYQEPVTTTDGFQVILPIVPANTRNAPDQSLVSTAFNVRSGDMLKGVRRQWK